eukprot:9469812-Pyramimonas_sp.AAC.1
MQGSHDLRPNTWEPRASIDPGQDRTHRVQRRVAGCPAGRVPEERRPARFGGEPYVGHVLLQEDYSKIVVIVFLLSFLFAFHIGKARGTIYLQDCDYL